MREIKDTLGIKLTHYSKVYNMDNAQLGLIIKYLLWHENSEYILENTPEYLKSKLLKRTAEDEQTLQQLLENDEVFARTFTDMSQQVKRSRECWHNLKNTLDNKNNKKTWYKLEDDGYISVDASINNYVAVERFINNDFEDTDGIRKGKYKLDDILSIAMEEYGKDIT